MRFLLRQLNEFKNKLIHTLLVPAILIKHDNISLPHRLFQLVIVHAAFELFQLAQSLWTETNSLHKWKEINVDGCIVVSYQMM